MADGTTTLPAPLQHDPAGVPDELKSAPRWVVWRYETRNGKATKIPLTVGGTYASTTDPSTWATYDAALAAYQSDGNASGVGFVLGDGWAGVDLDRDDEEARKYLDRLATYQERSPGGTGYHAIGRVSLSYPLKGSKRHGIEQYSQGRYFTITGHRVNDLPVADITPVLLEIHRKHNPPPVPRDHAEIVSKVSAAEPELWAGDASRFNGDHSSADLALVGCIAFWTQDPTVIDEVFRQSGLYREKWEREDYRKKTIEKALSTKTKFSAPAGEKPKPAEKDPKTDKLILSTNRTLPTATSFMASFYPDNSLVAHGGVLYGWVGSRYEQLEPDMIRNKLQWWLHDAVHWVKNGKTLELMPFPANQNTIDSALSAIKSLRSVLSSTVAPPAWIDGGHGPDPKQLLFGKTKMVHMPTGEEIACTPRMFNLTSINADYDPEAPEPTKWIKFLNELWPTDPESIDVLQQWFGYCLTADTSQQKALLMIGPKRGGKGTIARILREIIGYRNCAGPTTTSLAGAFGLASLIGKSLAVVGDARFNGEGFKKVSERLLTIIGEDPIQVDRKFLEAVDIRLPVRFMFLTNVVPRFTDASGTLPSRFITLELHQSWYGRENLTLEAELLEELPGILRWAVDGWVMLQERGRLKSPKSTESLNDEMEELASPVIGFVRDCCTLREQATEYPETLYLAYVAWTKGEGTEPLSKLSFLTNLRASFKDISRFRETGTRKWCYEGIEVHTNPAF